jgi:predicted peptidase
MDPIQEFVESQTKGPADPGTDLQSILRRHPALSQFLYGLVAVILPVFRGCDPSACVEGEFEPRMYHYAMALGEEHRCYELYVTDEYTPDQSWPLVLFWHGIIESGDDGFAHLAVGIGPALRERPEQFPCLVAMPQLPWNATYEDIDAIYAATLADVEARYNIDPNRISMTGISYGASGTWRYAAEHEGELSAILPIAGAGRDVDIPKLLDIPIWTFANANDELSDTADWRRFTEDLADAGANIIATELPGSTHEIWDRVYRRADITDWLLAQTLSPP